MPSARNTLVVALVVAIVAGALGPTIATAGVDSPGGSHQVQTTQENFLNVTTEYPASDDSEAVDVSVVVRPEEDTINNVSVTVQNTEQGFVDFETFSTTITPSGATTVEEDIDLDVQNRRKRLTFFIPELEPGESVRINFTAYPRLLQADGQQVNAARIDYRYLRNGVEVPDDAPGTLLASTDISGSPVYRANQLRTQVDGMWVLAGGGAALGIIGLAVGAFLLIQSRGGSSGGLRYGDVRSVKRDLDSLRTKVEARYPDSDILDEINDIVEDIDDALDRD